MATDSEVPSLSGEVLARAEGLGSMGSWTWEAGSEEMKWSPGLYRLAGMLPNAEIPTLALCRRLVHPDDLPGISDLKLLLATDWLDDRVFRIVRAGNEEVRSVRVHGRAMRDAEGTLLGISGICVDVTDQESHSVREHPDLTHAQVRAARAYLGWTAVELAEKAGVSFSTVRRVEMPGRRAVRDENIDAIRDAFTRSGVRFIIHSDGGIGIVGR